jgi:hypothetical protein
VIQLGAVVRSAVCKDYGLDISLFERMMALRPSFEQKLDKLFNEINLLVILYQFYGTWFSSLTIMLSCLRSVGFALNSLCPPGVSESCGGFWTPVFSTHRQLSRTLVHHE